MVLKSIEGTKVRGGVYQLNLRIPAELVEAYGGKSHLRRSLKTADPKAAMQAVTLAKAELIETAQARVSAGQLAEAIAALPPDQKARLDDAGGVIGLRQRFQKAAKAKAFLIAGGALTESDLTPTDEVGNGDREEIAPAKASADERVIAEATHKAELAALDRVVDDEAKTLKALGDKVKVPTSFGLRELVDAVAPQTGVRSSTVATLRLIVDRFIGFTGDLPLTELTIAHLRSFAEAYRDFPAHASTSDLVGQSFKDLLRIARAKDLPRLSEVTRKQHVGLLKGLTAKAPSQGYIAADPWAGFKLIQPKGKHAATKAKPRAPFTPDQVRALLAEAATHPEASIDRWAPLLAAYQGARREELGQLLGRNVFMVEGVWCIQITDEDEGQKVKNEPSVRTIPLHQKVLNAGFADFAASRPADAFLFADEMAKGLEPLKPNKHGRVTPRYGKRFATTLRKRLKITDDRYVFHSFRHSWEDAAEAVEMPQTHRRDLAGRSRAGDSQAAYGDGPKMPALKRSLDRIDPAGAATR